MFALKLGVAALVCGLFCVSAVHGDATRNLTQTILDNGYDVEIHNARTSDGWVLPLYRIGGKSRGLPVLLQHGLMSGADCWVLNTPESLTSLGYVLSDKGYDVWLANTRGCNWAPTNVLHAPTSTAYWNFTFDDMIDKDFPSTVEVVARMTGHKVAVVGHSQGTLMVFGALATNPSVQALVSSFDALAPVAHVGNTKSVLIRGLADLHAGRVVELFGDKSFGYEPKIVEKILPDLCKVDPDACKDVISLTTGHNCCINNTRIPFYLSLEPSETSVKNMLHYSQQVRSGRFCKFDYGREGNMAAYGSATAPAYDLGAIPSTTPIALHFGAKDDLGDTKDVMIIAKALGALKNLKVIPYDNFAHLDFVVGSTTDQKLIPNVLAHLQAFPQSPLL